MRAALLLPLLVACQQQAEDPLPLVTAIDGGGPIRVAVAPTLGGLDLDVPVRLLNAYGAAVAGGDVTVSIDGPTASPASLTVSLDGNGLGVARVTTTAPEQVVITATASSDGAEVGASAPAYAVSDTAPAYATAWGSHLGLADGDLPSHGAPATGGMAISVEDAVWFVPAAPGAPAVQVADLPFTVEGLQGAHIDRDGLLDLVVFGENQVVLLRGVAQGGHAWAGGYQARAGSVVGAMTSDIDGDRLGDLIVATSRESGGGVQVLVGDGAWGFEALPPLDLAEEIWSVTGSDEFEDGVPDLSVLTAGRGTIKRYSWRPEEAGWVGASTSELVDYEATEGARLLPQTDLDGDGRDEIIIRGAEDRTPHELVFYTLTDPVYRFPLSYPRYEVGLADVDDDGIDDLLVMEEGRITVTSVNDDGGFSEIPVNLPSDRGPVVGGHFGGDAGADILVATDHALVFPGRTDDDGWDKVRPTWRSFATALAGPILVEDLDGDGSGDSVGFTSDGTDLVMATWLLDPSAGQLQFGGRLTLGAVDALGIAHCGPFWYALVGSDDDSTLITFQVDAAAQPQQLASTSTAGSLLACGVLPNGNEGVVVSTTSGFWIAHGPYGTEQDSGNVGQSGAVALARSGGAGALASCPADGCSIAAADLDGDGVDEVARGGDTVTLEWGGDTLALAGAGHVSFADFDDDGAVDLLATDVATGRVYAWRNLGNQLAPAIVLATDRDLGAGPAFISDTTGDGVPELAVIDLDGSGNWRTSFGPASLPAGTAW